ncbi:MAG: GNAT family N-acetyltransferase [Caldilineaceae bacterium]|nr:GNAT family N-acetyltransferase [Caldilineaceae bacterium]
MTIRLARPADAAAIAKVHVAAWQVAYRGLLPDAMLDSLSVEQRTQAWHEILTLSNNYTLVCTQVTAETADEQIVGFAGCGECRDTDLNDGRTGELYAIYLDPAIWRQGHGTALLDAALKLLEQDGYRLVTLWVLEGNQQAMQFYQSMGFAPDGGQQTEQLADGVEVCEWRYRRSV